MSRRKRDKLEFRFYELPRGEKVLALTGEDWVGTYGHDDICMHFHNLFEIGFCHHGYGMLTLGEKEYVYEDGMLSAIPANYPHITLSEGEDAWEFLFFDPDELLREMYPDNPGLQEEKLSVINKRADLFRSEDRPELAAVVVRLLREAREKKPYYQEAVEHLVKLYLLELIRIQEKRADESMWMMPSNSATIAQVAPSLQYMEAHYAEHLRAEDLAAACGMSEVHFRRLFKENLDMVPMDYLNLIRIQKACALINRRDCPMEVVAESCGFSSLSTFTRNFRKYLNTTPYQWKLNKERSRRRLSAYEVSTQKGWEKL